MNEFRLYSVSIENEPDSSYKDLVQNEIIFIRKHKDKIIHNATLLYTQKSQNYNQGYVKSALPFVELENLCTNFQSLKG